MQCDLRSMAKKKADSETMPRPGKVHEACREWAVHEDGAMAYRLQHQEIQQHYTGNKTRNAQVREDIPTAKTEQRKEEEEAAYIKAMYEQMLKEQEDMDAEVARRLAERLEREEEEKRQRTEQRDRKIASHFQAQEQRKPKAEPELAQSMSQMSISEVAGPSGLRMSRRPAALPPETANSDPMADLSDFCLQPDPHMTEEEARVFQEEQDAELARLLQEQEMKRRGDSGIDKDRQMAVEAQDHEFARMLHDKERAKLRRAKERARLKRLQKEEEEAGGGAVAPNEGPRGTGKPRFPDPPQTVAQNIAVAIDPTYNQKTGTLLLAAPPAVSPEPTPSEIDLIEELELDEEDEEEAPPYMPIQGQRRTASLEKKRKKDQGCKQQ